MILARFPQLTERAAFGHADALAVLDAYEQGRAGLSKVNGMATIVVLPPT
jgi:hypothetical protein